MGRQNRIFVRVALSYYVHGKHYGISLIGLAFFRTVAACTALCKCYQKVYLERTELLTYND